MSIGHRKHGEGEPNLLTPDPKRLAMLHRLLTSGDAPQLMQRWQQNNFDNDIVYTCGYNTAGTTRFADRDFVRALNDPSFALQILGAYIDTGLSPTDTIHCVFEHEGVEKVIIDADNPIDFYDYHDEPEGWGAHEYATLAEHQMVRRKGGDPAKYEKGLAGIIKFCEHKQLVKVPKDYACAPLLDDPDENEKRGIKRLRELGVVDASKISKETVEYEVAHDPTRHCAICSMWQGPREQTLSPCSLVDGLVRNNRVCDKFEAIPPAHQDHHRDLQDAAKAVAAHQAEQEIGRAAENPPDSSPDKSGQKSAQSAPSPDVAALADSVAKMAAAVSELAKSKKKPKKRVITTHRDDQGNLTAAVEDQEDQPPSHDLDHNAHAKWRAARQRAV
jgi:hypothetical protein